MAAIILVAMAILVRYSLALTQTELSQFTARTHTEQNSNTQGTVTITTEGTNHRLVANGIPDHNTGTFPGTGNPNMVTSQNYDVEFPKDPVVAAQPTCLPKGPIAFTKNGIPMYNPYNANNENAVEGPTAEQFDLCDGHPDGRGSYHYHQTPKCVSDGSNDQFIGVAMDGFPIYGTKLLPPGGGSQYKTIDLDDLDPSQTTVTHCNLPNTNLQDSSGKTLTSADLDECHGRVENGEYRYRLTADFPYIMACFKGTPNINQQMLNAADCKIITTGTTTSHSEATTQGPDTMSTPPPNGMSTPPQNGMSTPPLNGMSTPPMGGMSPTSLSGMTVSSTVGGTSTGTRTAPMLSIMFVTLCLCVFMG